MLPVNGSREALFALAQTVIDATRAGATVVCPNPFYQIYEGAALLAGARTAFANSDPARNFAADWSQHRRRHLGAHAVALRLLAGQPDRRRDAAGGMAARCSSCRDRHGFVIASDECYSEIYFRDEADAAARRAGGRARAGPRRLPQPGRCSPRLSKRSNVPGMRSGFVAGDAQLMKAFLLYRTYHGSAMSPVVQAASIAAWSDEAARASPTARCTAPSSRR